MSYLKTAHGLSLFPQVLVCGKVQGGGGGSPVVTGAVASGGMAHNRAAMSSYKA